jgi:uncharacterized protein YbjT (DUF2867 family)
MTAEQLDVVTGAFSYSGAVVAAELQARGHRVRTLTGHPDRAPAGTEVEIRPLDFSSTAQLTDSLRGAHTLYNTYWVRFPHGEVTHDLAVRNSAILFDAAVAAGVQRIVHVSIMHASLDSADSYFRGKAQVEQALAETGIPHAIARPSVLFGGSGVLINNIAWLLRHLPVFGIGGGGHYRLRPIHVDDLAALLVRLGQGTDTVIMDAGGPESLPFRELVAVIKQATGSRALVVPVPGTLIPPMAALLNLGLRDTLLTAGEYRAMAAGLADSPEPPAGTIVLTDWIRAHGSELGRHYANELDRHFRAAPARTAA